MAAENEYIKEAYDTIYMLSREEDVREQCKAREDYYRRQRTMQHYLDTALAEKEAAEQRADAAEAEVASLKALVAKLQAEKASTSN